MIGRTLSHYEILGQIGSGGMGDVFRARDTRLGREIAIKVLPSAFAENKERLARFQREARLLASLNHPNIGAIHELEESDGVHFLVLELVEGETLAERIAMGPIPADEALPLFEQIAEGLEAAHEKGVVHRDLKPANIKITPEGKAKVLDFGLAKALAGKETQVSDLSQSPTVTREGTETGVLLGTAPYMSPEQARGKAVDKRADVWAFGCCLYEALTGRGAFLGETVSDTLAKVLEREPDWDALPEATPRLVRRLLGRCLQKDLNRRIHDIADARIDLEEARAVPSESLFADVPTVRPRKSVLPWALVGLVAGLAGLTIWAPWRAGRDFAPQLVRTSLILPRAQKLNLGTPPLLALSSDGSRLVYSASEEGQHQLFLRELSQGESTPIPGTEGGYDPFFSPDGGSVGFQAGGLLKKVRLDGAGAAEICDAPGMRGASWRGDDTIVFSAGDGLMMVSAEGGAPEVLTTIDSNEGERGHYWPEILPNGKAILFSIVTGGNYDDSRIVVQSLESGERRFLLNASYARYVPTGHLVYAREDTLYAVPFDANSFEVGGSGIPVQTGVFVNSGGPGSAHMTFSSRGTLIYVAAPPMERRLVFVDLRGTVEPLPAPSRPYQSARFSPDGRRLALGVRRTDATSEIYLYELAQGRLSLVTSQFEGPSGAVFKPGWGPIVWSPDGKSFAVNATAPGFDLSLFLIAADGSGSAEQLTEGRGYRVPYAFSPDGTRLLYMDQHPTRTQGRGIFELSLADRSSRVVVDPRGAQRDAALSTDGHWLAYTSSESGQHEVYVTAYDRAGGRRQASKEGGEHPAWAPDGRTLYYRNGERMMAADITTGPGLFIGTPRLLFKGPFFSEQITFIRDYDLTPDGRKFVMVQDERELGPTEFRVVLNWFEELKRLVPTE